MMSSPPPPVPQSATLKDPDKIAQRSVDLAETLLRRAQSIQRGSERELSERLSRMMEDPRGKELTIAMVDQAFRSHEPARIADQLSHLLDEYGTPRYMDWWERVALTLGGVMGHYLPEMVVPPVVARLRQETRSVILPGEEGDLRKYLKRRRADGTRLNLNQLGEAILGEEEAKRRMQAYLALLARPDVEYISVKVSSIFSQIHLVGYEKTLEQVKERLRTLYRQALTHHYRGNDDIERPKFVNLDMEEYRDLHLTVDAFRDVLDEPEFRTLSAGIVLQAYIPDSHPVQVDLTRWAIERCRSGGAPIKVRIVKGANLAMERVDASIHGWPQAPYNTKVDVDANFKRMVIYGMQPEHAQAVHLGVASHNLFDIAFAMVLRTEMSVEDEVEFEMLEGMANHQARSVQEEAGGLLLYAPVVKSEDFHSAIAYLVRRLDENTAPENFLHDLFSMEPGSSEWEEQKANFLESLERLESAATRPNRSQDRRTSPEALPADVLFANEPGTDWALPANQEWIVSVRNRWQDREFPDIPLQIDGEEIHMSDQANGVDPSRPDGVAYRYSLADGAAVDRALAVADRAQPTWSNLGSDERRRILNEVGNEFARCRGDLIGAMMLEAAKIPSEADAEVSEGVDFARYYARTFPPRDCEDLEAEPFGTVVVTPPWNFPFAIPAGGILAALMAGNSVIFKPAPEAVLVGWELASAMWRAGVPRDVLTFLPTTDDEVGRSLIEDERTDAVILTGSIETANLFQSWRPHLRLFAETSGKNGMIITSMADRDQAIKDLVHSAISHNGQKCSAASLAILEAEVYDDHTFRRQLKDAVASRAVGSVWDLASLQTPLTQPPGARLYRALTTLDPGEEWLLKPRPIGLDGSERDGERTHRLWTPGIKLGVQPGSFFHRTECFGPVLGLMRATDLEDALDMVNAVDFGLTGGIHTLDDREIARYRERAEVGNAYINRGTTGAIVRRQPFGGWKASNVGPGAKAGGPNYVLQFARWRSVGESKERMRPAPAVASMLSRIERMFSDAGTSRLSTAAASYAAAWDRHFSREHDPSSLLGEENIFRYRPLPKVFLRADESTDRVSLALAVIAARTVGARVLISLGQHLKEWSWLEREEGFTIIYEDESGLAAQIEASQEDPEHLGARFRGLGPLSTDLRSALNKAGIDVVEDPVLENGRLELRHYLREQAISQTVHRYGNVMERYRKRSGPSR